MSNVTIGVSQELNSYIRSVTIKETPQLEALRSETMALKEKSMQISPEQGQFMALMVRLLNASKIIEVGVFTGYSALCMAKELPENGQLVACDVSKEWTDIGQSYWNEAGVSHKIDLRLAPAIETLDGLLAEGLSGQFDIVFIDADKTNYLQYYERALRLVRKGGLIMVDNTLWSGAVADPEDISDDTVAIRELNLHIASDVRVKSSLLPISDGVTLVTKC